MHKIVPACFAGRKNPGYLAKPTKSSSDFVVQPLRGKFCLPAYRQASKIWDKIKFFLIILFSAGLFLFHYAGLRASPDSPEKGKRGVVIYVNEESNYIFISLGQEDVKKGDVAEVYRDSKLIANASIKTVMGNMSEASIIKRDGKPNIGDMVIVYEGELPSPEAVKAKETVDNLKKKLAELEEEKNKSESKLSTEIVHLKEREKALEKKLETLDEAKELAEKSFKAELMLLEKSKGDTVAELDKRITSLKDKKEKTESLIEAQMAPLETAKESIKKGLISSEKVTESTVDRLEEKLESLQKSRKQAIEEIKREIRDLEGKKEIIKAPPSPEREKISQAAKEVKKAELPKKPAPVKDEREKIRQATKDERTKGRKDEKIKTPTEKKAPAKAKEKPPVLIARKDTAKVREKAKDFSRTFAVEKVGEALSLDECIAIAIDNHLPLKIAAKQLRLAEFRVIEAMRKFGPSVTATWEESGGQIQDRYYDGAKINVEAKQPVFYGGELTASAKQAKVNLEIVKNEHDRLENELILQVKKAYYNLDKTEKALLVQKKLEKKANEFYETTKSGYEKGVISKIEVLEVESQYNQANFQMTSAREDIAVANLILQQAMNVDGEVRIVQVGDPKMIELTLEECFDYAYLNRPEMKISQLSVEHFEYEKKIMEARAFWPRVDLLGMYGNAREDFLSRDSEVGRNPRHLGPEHYFGAKVTMPVWGSTLGYSFTKEKWQPVVSTTRGSKSESHDVTFSVLDKLEDLSALKEADIEYMRAEDELNKKKQEITLEVKEEFFKYKKALFLIDVAASKLEFQRKQVEILRVRRELGDAQYSDVIEEMIKLAEEEFSYVQAIADYYIAVASLNKAVGIDGHFTI